MQSDTRCWCCIICRVLIRRMSSCLRNDTATALRTALMILRGKMRLLHGRVGSSPRKCLKTELLKSFLSYTCSVEGSCGLHLGDGSTQYRFSTWRSNTGRRVMSITNPKRLSSRSGSTGRARAQCGGRSPPVSW